MHHMRPIHCVPLRPTTQTAQGRACTFATCRPQFVALAEASRVWLAGCDAWWSWVDTKTRERFMCYKELRLNRKPSQLDFLPCWISDLHVEVISLVRAWRIMQFDVYICPGVYVCVPLAVPSTLPTCDHVPLYFLPRTQLWEKHEIKRLIGTINAQEKKPSPGGGPSPGGWRWCMKVKWGFLVRVF